eukprot:6111001-Pleurochrysis_carterae.AAC.2
MGWRLICVVVQRTAQAATLDASAAGVDSAGRQAPPRKSARVDRQAETAQGAGDEREQRKAPGEERRDSARRRAARYCARRRVVRGLDRARRHGARHGARRRVVRGKNSARRWATRGGQQ